MGAGYRFGRGCQQGFEWHWGVSAAWAECIGYAEFAAQIAIPICSVKRQPVGKKTRRNAGDDNE